RTRHAQPSPAPRPDAAWRALASLTAEATPFFFFHAEDGIRARNVTGVQTCALPILQSRSSSGVVSRVGVDALIVFDSPCFEITRSEERRVGKECTSGYGTENEKKSRAVKQSNDETRQPTRGSNARPLSTPGTPAPSH